MNKMINFIVQVIIMTVILKVFKPVILGGVTILKEIVVEVGQILGMVKKGA